MSGHRIEECHRPRWLFWFLWHHRIWWCDCGKAYRLHTGCAGPGCVTYWRHVPELDYDPS